MPVALKEALINDLFASHFHHSSQAIGGPLEPYWGIYQQHLTSDVRSILDKYKIGKLSADDDAKIRVSSSLMSLFDTHFVRVRIQINAQEESCCIGGKK